VLIRGSVSIRTEENHLLRVKLLHQHLQVGKELVGNPVDWIARVPQDVFADC
jgi:ribosomal protein L16/L10AE